MEELSQEEQQNFEDDGVLEEVDISEFTEGNNIFESHGISRLKVTSVGSDPETRKPITVARALRVAIKSSGVSEFIEEFSKNSPTPPAVNKIAKPGSAIAKELGINKKQWVQVFDFTDPSYVKANDAYRTELGMKIVLMGLASPIKDKEGNIVEDDKQKIRILQGMGLTSEHFTQLVTDITNLTKWAEVKDSDFLEE